MIEGRGFRALEQDFEQLGVRIVGVSLDPVEANARFRADQGFGFELWSDSTRALSIHFGAAKSPRTRIVGRRTVVIDEEGRLVLDYPSVLNVLGHPQQVLEDCAALFRS